MFADHLEASRADRIEVRVPCHEDDISTVCRDFTRLGRRATHGRSCLSARIRRLKSSPFIDDAPPRLADTLEPRAWVRYGYRGPHRGIPHSLH